MSYDYALSIAVVSFNTRDLLRDCLHALLAECARLPGASSAEILVVDNGSRDGSAEMVAREFSATATPVRLIASAVNLGFGVANNRAIEQARGRYIVLVNSDAFPHEGALARALARMDADPTAGAGGARLVKRDGSWQPSARAFPSIWCDACLLTGLAKRFPRSRILAAAERTWADPAEAAAVDWVTGAFLILRRQALDTTGLFDPRFFLYCEEVDLCRRIHAAGFRVLYWPDIVVTHLHGESSRQAGQEFSEHEAQILLWRMRSLLLYYRKHHGAQVWLARWLEELLYMLRYARNRYSSTAARRARAQEALRLIALVRQAWRETRGGRVSPPAPW
jgi:hypothetical protein